LTIFTQFECYFLHSVYQCGEIKLHKTHSHSVNGKIIDIMNRAEYVSKQIVSNFWAVSKSHGFKYRRHEGQLFEGKYLHRELFQQFQVEYMNFKLNNNVIFLQQYDKERKYIVLL